MENTKNLYEAFIKAQLELKNPAKNKEAKGDKFSYSYTSLDRLIEETKPILLKHGLCIIQELVGDGNKIGVKTTLGHISGESMSETFWVPVTELRGGASVMQGIGASISYARRYALSSILNLASEDDTDANVGATITDTPPNPRRFNPDVKTTNKGNGSAKSTPFSKRISKPTSEAKPVPQNNKPKEESKSKQTSKFPTPKKPQFKTGSFSSFINKRK